MSVVSENDIRSVLVRVQVWGLEGENEGGSVSVVREKDIHSVLGEVKVQGLGGKVGCAI